MIITIYAIIIEDKYLNEENYKRNLGLFDCKWLLLWVRKHLLTFEVVYVIFVKIEDRILFYWTYLCLLYLAVLNYLIEHGLFGGYLIVIEGFLVAFVCLYMIFLGV